MSSIARARTTGVAHPLASLLFFQCFIDQGVLEKKKKTRAALSHAPLSHRPTPATVRALREELQLLQEPGSYVGEVVKV